MLCCAVGGAPSFSDGDHRAVSPKLNKHGLINGHLADVAPRVVAGDVGKGQGVTATGTVVHR